MAPQDIQLDRESFSCPICLDLLKNPVTLGCGHSYCMICIQPHWDHEDQGGTWSCPQCGQTFTPRPVLRKNTMLADLVEELKKTGLQAAAADHCYSGPEDVACDVCTGRKQKALRSCLVCLVSYCEHHLRPHLQSPAFKKHKLGEPNKRLRENMCPQHGEVMKMFCRTDKQCICYLCSVDGHKGHNIVSAAEEWTESQRELGLGRQTLHQRHVELLQQEEAINSSADQAVGDSQRTFAELIHLLENRSSDVKKQIRSQQETEASQVKELQERLEQEITELKRKHDELKEISHTEDPIQFLHNCPSLPLSVSTHSYSTRVHPLGNYEAVTTAVSQVRDQLQDTLMEILSQPEPKTRADFLKYAQELTLDPNTAHRDLCLSEGNRRVTHIKSGYAEYSHHPDRFTCRPQVLSTGTLTGSCYWEVERGEEGGGFVVAVAYKDISRSPWFDSGFGCNDKSWGLTWYGDTCNFLHNNIWTPVSAPPYSRVGVYVDHTAGVLSFYNVSDTMTLLHSVRTTFTQPLCAGLDVFSYGSTAKLCELQQMSVSQSFCCTDISCQSNTALLRHRCSASLCQDRI